MLNRYGPWATMIDLGGRPQLSTFWRHRLTMLTPASRTSFVLSRSNLLWLAAAAVLLMALPTVHFAAAAIDEVKSSDRNVAATTGAPGEKPAEAKPSAVEGSKAESHESGRLAIFGTTTLSTGSSYIPSIVYGELNSAGTRKAIGLTNEQEKRLRDVSHKYSGQQSAAGAEMRKMMETLPPEKREAAFAQYRARLLEVRSAVRKELEQLLSAAQLKELQTIAVGSQGVSRLRYDRALGDRVGLSEEQMKQLLSRMIEGRAARESELRLVDELKKNDEAALALITPQQWKEIEKIPTDFPPQFPGPELTQLVNPDTAKKLGLSAEQQVKVNKLLANCIAKAQELQKLVSDINGPRPIEEVAATSRILDRKQQEIKKHDRDEIAAMLTPQQLAGLKQAVLGQEFLNRIRYPMQFGIGGNDAAYGFLDRIQATAEQKRELRRLMEEEATLLMKNFRERGAAVMEILRPDQRDKLIDALDRESEPLTVTPSAGAGGQEAGRNEAKRPPRILPPKIDAVAAGTEALNQFDLNHDGKLSGAELDKCPGLKAAIDQIDRSGKGEITAEKIAARIKAWQDSRLGRMSLGCRVLHNGEALAGAEVKFVPEKFLGKNLKVATGKTDANGVAMIAAQEPGPPGVAPGFYRIEITKAGEDIPTKYNKETVFGQEVAMDAKGIQEGITLDLKY